MPWNPPTLRSRRVRPTLRERTTKEVGKGHVTSQKPRGKVLRGETVHSCPELLSGQNGALWDHQHRGDLAP